MKEAKHVVTPLTSRLLVVDIECNVPYPKCALSHPTLNASVSRIVPHRTFPIAEEALTIGFELLLSQAELKFQSQ